MRQIEEILTEMDTVKAGYPQLNALESTSDVSLFGQMRQMWAQLVQLVEASWDRTASAVEKRLAAEKPGGLFWYVNQAKQFQFGDSVTVIDGRAAYQVIAAEKQIITQATMNENQDTGRLTFRVAKKGLSGLTALSTDELAAFKTYVSKVKYAGVIIDCLSLEADQVRITATAKVDGQMISDSGILLSDGVTMPVTKAINAYLSAIPYDNFINNTALTDAVQAVPGVKDFTISAAYIRRPTDGFWPTLPYQGEVQSVAGHALLHVDSNITYTY